MMNNWTGQLDLVLPDSEDGAHIEVALWARQDLTEVSTIARLSPSTPPPITWGGRITRHEGTDEGTRSARTGPIRNAAVQFPDGTSSLVDLLTDDTLVGSGVPPAVLQHGMKVA